MIMTTIQKIIRIGSSKGATLPAKQLKELGVDIGDKVRITVETIEEKDTQQQVLREYEAFVEQYDETLKNLAGR